MRLFSCPTCTQISRHKWVLEIEKDGNAASFGRDKVGVYPLSRNSAITPTRTTLSSPTMLRSEAQKETQEAQRKLAHSFQGPPEQWTYPGIRRG